jgi:hypothetical protein
MKDMNIVIVVGLRVGALWRCAGRQQRCKGNHIVKSKICALLLEGVQKGEVYIPFLLGFMTYGVCVHILKLGMTSS